MGNFIIALNLDYHSRSSGNPSYPPRFPGELWRALPHFFALRETLSKNLGNREPVNQPQFPPRSQCVIKS